mmetsp:Transcript_12127/g.18098  ORF Transcript_12127/g.18098 Transcript_12127/m.18098 type:complete len:196 (+) Transcript_12127:1061-1648(+)
MDHIGVLEQFVKEFVDKPTCVALVLEDDAVVDNDFSGILKRELPKIPSGWDFISFEAPEKVCEWGVWQNEGLNIWHNMRLIDKYIYIPPLTWPGVYTGGYLISTRGAMRILDKLPLTSNIDTWVNQLSFFGSINMMVRCPALVRQGSSSETARGGPKVEGSQKHTYLTQTVVYGHIFVFLAYHFRILFALVARKI